MEEEYIYRNQKKMRRGYTTGSCAAAAACAATSMALMGERKEAVEITTPKGIRLILPVEEISREENGVSCGVRKDGGDDPDATHGILIYARAERLQEGEEEPAGCYQNFCESGPVIYLDGGTGIGRVTKPGLACPEGKAAINPVPRSMIFQQAEAVCKKAGFTGRLKLTISAPEGERIAGKTFNPYLGILGGISILGTTGIVEPMSQAALIETIRISVRQKAALGEKILLIVPGNYGEDFLKTTLKIDPDRAVKCSNYIGEALDIAVEYGFQNLLLVGHGGKLIKLAAGVMNTHSSVADSRMEALAAWAGAQGAGAENVRQILESVTVDEALSTLDRAGITGPVMEKIIERIGLHLKKRGGNTLKAEAILFTNQKGVLGMTKGAEELLKCFLLPCPSALNSDDALQ